MHETGCRQYVTGTAGISALHLDGDSLFNNHRYGVESSGFDSFFVVSSAVGPWGSHLAA